MGSHLPGWIKSLLPKSALTTEEEAWNAYPFTKTRYTCPFVEKFSIEIETYYFSDDGHQENVFKLSSSELRNRTVGRLNLQNNRELHLFENGQLLSLTDIIDIVKDPMDYPKEEDPRSFVSQKTGRGPLTDTWLADHWREVKGKQQPTANNMSLMCAYKLCRVEFRYWGMQTKLEKFIHDIALRKTMQRAHCQAWAWQDEWFGLTMDDIRQIERETQLALQQKMMMGGREDDGGSQTEAPEQDNSATVPDQSVFTMTTGGNSSSHNNNAESIERRRSMAGTATTSAMDLPQVKEPLSEGDSSEEEEDEEEDEERNKSKYGHTDYAKSSLFGSKSALHSPIGSAHSFDLQVCC